MEKRTKAETFIGFAMRSGKFRIGANAATTLKRAYLVIVCKSASDNTKKDALKLAKNFKSKLLETTTFTLEELTHRDNAKVMAIADRALAKAIADNSESDFIERTGD